MNIIPFLSNIKYGSTIFNVEKMLGFTIHRVPISISNQKLYKPHQKKNNVFLKKKKKKCIPMCERSLFEGVNFLNNV